MNPVSGDSRLLADVYGADGYSTVFYIDDGELEYLRAAIFRQWLARITTVCPEHSEVFREAGLQGYHRLSHLISHESLWTKEHRVLPKESVAALGQMDFVRRLIECLGGSCRISNVVFFSGEIPGYPEVYWRLVRPQEVKDVGPLHADRWFHDQLGGGSTLYADSETTIKIWLAIYAEPGLNGLYVVPGSHRKSWRVKYTAGTDGHLRPSLDEPLGEYSRQLLPVIAGQTILFNENLLHGGAVNAASTSRVSVEMTFVLQRSSIPL